MSAEAYRTQGEPRYSGWDFAATVVFAIAALITFYQVAQFFKWISAIPYLYGWLQSGWWPAPLWLATVIICGIAYFTSDDYDEEYERNDSGDGETVMNFGIIALLLFIITLLVKMLSYVPWLAIWTHIAG